MPAGRSLFTNISSIRWDIAPIICYPLDLYFDGLDDEIVLLYMVPVCTGTLES